MHGHPPGHDGACARLALARETRGKAANSSSTATTSHQVPSAARLHSQSCGHMGSREHRRQNALPNLPAESVCRHSCSVGAHVCAMVARDNDHAWAQSIQPASTGGTRRQPSKRAGGSARETDVDGAQLLAWMTTVNQQLSKNRLQWQSSTLII